MDVASMVKQGPDLVRKRVGAIWQMHSRLSPAREDVHCS
jgi:hypothetical protein